MKVKYKDFLKALDQLKNYIGEVEDHTGPHGRDAYLKRKKAHYCYEWDGMYIDKDMDEFSVCSCFSESK